MDFRLKWLLEETYSFISLKHGQKKYFNMESKKYEALPGTESFIILDSFRDLKPQY
jgi:hypothetical protein